MNWGQFKDPVSHMCLAGAVVASWSLMQEMAGSSLFTVMTNIFVSKFMLSRGMTKEIIATKKLLPVGLNLETPQHSTSILTSDSLDDVTS